MAGQGPPAVEMPKPRVQGSFYGLAIDARRVLFLLDISGSMFGPKLAAAKRELNGVVNQLPGDAWFGIIVFNSQLTTWQPRLVPATSVNKQKAGYFVDSLQARGRTATYDALERALHMDAEAVYLVSDGLPTCGKIVPIPAIAAVVNPLQPGPTGLAVHDWDPDPDDPRGPVVPPRARGAESGRISGIAQLKAESPEIICLAIFASHAPPKSARQLEGHVALC